MSYRKVWRECKKWWPEVRCIGMSDSYRIVKQPSDGGREFFSLGDGRTRKLAWERAALNAHFVYNYYTKRIDEEPQ